jgi:hypothetical protein
VSLIIFNESQIKLNNGSDDELFDLFGSVPFEHPKKQNAMVARKIRRLIPAIIPVFCFLFITLPPILSHV